MPKSTNMSSNYVENAPLELKQTFTTTYKKSHLKKSGFFGN